MKSLEGKFIRVFCAGGWEIDGQVISEGKTRILLKNKNEFLIYKESISLIEFIDVSNRDKDTNSVKGDKGEVYTHMYIVIACFALLWIGGGGEPMELSFAILPHGQC